MSILSPTLFLSVVSSSKEMLINISDIINKKCGEKKSKLFISACENLDYQAANELLNDLVEELTGLNSISVAIDAFVKKFPQLSPVISEEISAVYSEKKKIQILDKYRNQILDIIDETQKV